MIKKNYKNKLVSKMLASVQGRKSPVWKGQANHNYGGQVRGQASIEFVLVIPLLIVIIFAVSQLGYYIYCKNILVHAAREGARVLTTTNSNMLAIRQVLKSCSSLDPEMLNIELNPPSNNAREIGDFASIDLSYIYGGKGNFLSIIMGRDIYITSSCLMRMECGD